MTEMTYDPATVIERIVVNPSDVIEGVLFNRRAPEYRNNRKAVIRLSPPFSEEMEASLYYYQSGNRYPPEMDPKPIHVAPKDFLEDEMVQRCPNRHDERAWLRDELDDQTEEKLEKYVQEAFEVWEEEARQSLVETVDIRRHHTDEPHTVKVQYE